jgi:hypothetical protein
MRRRLPITGFAAGLLLAVACSGGSPDGGSGEADSLTRRQRDSAVAESGLPGAAGVRGAMDAADSASARAGRIDSMAGN